MLLVAFSAARGNAQCTRSDSTGALAVPTLRGIGTAADDSARLGSLMGACWGNGSLIRSSLTPTRARSVNGLTLTMIDPSTTSTWNSQLSVSFNDGAMWAGRGLNVGVSAGFRAEYQRLRVVVFPTIVTSQNLPFPILPSPDPSKSSFASPWQAGPAFADLPLRFGNLRYTRVDPGETAVEVAFPRVAAGVTSAASWWGPGIRNALVMSNNAAGIPRVNVRTARPLSTRLGQVEAQWLLGALSESPFFDSDGRNNLRSLSAATVTLRLSADTGLTIGAARAVYATVGGFARMPEHLGDVFFDWHQAPLEGPVDRKSDQITSLFARWVIPEAGIAAHVEWAKLRLPISLREVLVEPQLNQGYTLGLEWARNIGAMTVVRAQGELTTLEQTPTTAAGTAPEFYASHSVVHGYTQQGQGVGAAIGPGSSSQYLAGSVLHSRWRFDGSIGRIRWQEGAYYRPPSQGRFAWRTHDVSFFGGIGAARDFCWMQVEASWLRTLRMNYLFQTPNAFLPSNTTFDMRNTTLGLKIVPHLSTRRSETTRR